MDHQTEVIELYSNRRIFVSSDIYAYYYLNFNDYQEFYFNTIMNSGLCFPRLMQFISVMIALFNGFSSFHYLFLLYLASGLFFTLIWHLMKLHKFIPGICSLSCFIVGNLFRYKLHYIPIGLAAWFVIGDWKVILYCIAGSVVSSIIDSLLTGGLTTVKYNDAAVIYASKFMCK